MHLTPGLSIYDDPWDTVMPFDKCICIIFNCKFRTLFLFVTRASGRENGSPRILFNVYFLIMVYETGAGWSLREVSVPISRCFMTNPPERLFSVQQIRSATLSSRKYSLIYSNWSFLWAVWCQAPFPHPVMSESVQRHHNPTLTTDSGNKGGDSWFTAFLLLFISTLSI